MHYDPYDGANIDCQTPLFLNGRIVETNENRTRIDCVKEQFLANITDLITTTTTTLSPDTILNHHFINFTECSWKESTYPICNIDYRNNATDDFYRIMDICEDELPVDLCVDGFSPCCGDDCAYTYGDGIVYCEPDGDGYQDVLCERCIKAGQVYRFGECDDQYTENLVPSRTWYTTTEIEECDNARS
eukprot:UN29355